MYHYFISILPKIKCFFDQCKKISEFNVLSVNRTAAPEELSASHYVFINIQVKIRGFHPTATIVIDSSNKSFRVTY